MVTETVADKVMAVIMVTGILVTPATMEISKEMLEKAKEAKTYDELKALADANGVEMTEEDAKAMVEEAQPDEKRLFDEE